MKIRSVETELFHADKRTDGRRDRQTGRQTDREADRQTERYGVAIITFLNFMKAPIISI